ncbi:hypothetical protein SDC9_198711 [bioreactor metagenome]|uniref:Uncharacterized protein n=1 Tax=bioreactor metagenome TaxID=1076179 RepID=A0A645IIW9_9ZZZZ
MDISAEAVFLPQHAQGLDHQLGGAVRAAGHRGAEEKPLNIVAAVKGDGQLAKLPGCEGGPGRIV